MKIFSKMVWALALCLGMTAAYAGGALDRFGIAVDGVHVQPISNLDFASAEEQFWGNNGVVGTNHQGGARILFGSYGSDWDWRLHLSYAVDDDTAYQMSYLHSDSSSRRAMSTTAQLSNTNHVWLPALGAEFEFVEASSRLSETDFRAGTTHTVVRTPRMGIDGNVAFRFERLQHWMIGNATLANGNGLGNQFIEQSDLKLGGPTLGMRTRWGLPWNFSLYGGLRTAVLVGNTNGRLVSQNAADGNSRSTKVTRTKAVPTLGAEFGLTYNRTVFSQDFSLTLGWEGEHFHNAILRAKGLGDAANDRYTKFNEDSVFLNHSFVRLGYQFE